MTKLIKLTICDVEDAHGNVEDTERFAKLRAARTTGPWEFEAIQGFFKQSDPDTDDSTFDFIEEHLGLAMGSWDGLKSRLSQLNRDSEPSESYKLIFFARHGQGNHNRIVDLYGADMWNQKFAVMTSTILPSGEKITWAPDPDLTEKGRAQAEETHEAIVREIKRGLPLPSKLFCSPLRRAATTQMITWRGLTLCREEDDESLLLTGKRQHPIFKESLRETIGRNLCDKRKSKADIASHFVPWGFKFEEGFREEDPLFANDSRESMIEQSLRADSFLQELFEENPDDEVIYTTSHAAEIRAFINATGHRLFSIPTAGIIPMVIKGTRRNE
ncbi:DEKNAAC102895 [Brettanomyces naardenensis]|uniref:DEKNAAC102895 n=1 Tax=Brettanomyces naardenensis TaxID=13370 RepID=A0A448YM45_BRENA|nr:DEKNAAC102895 [Brettanomyces naardenensis]